MKSISWGDISKQDRSGDQVVDPQRAAQIMDDLLRRIEGLEKRLKILESK